VRWLLCSKPHPAAANASDRKAAQVNCFIWPKPAGHCSSRVPVIEVMRETWVAGEENYTTTEEAAASAGQRAPGLAWRTPARKSRSASRVL
jgi:hypothetical protein